MLKRLLLLCLTLSIVLAACSSKKETSEVKQEDDSDSGVMLDDKGNPKEVIKVSEEKEKEVKGVIEKNRKSLNDGNVSAYISTLDRKSKQLNTKEEEKALKDTLKSYTFDKQISNIKFLEDKNNKIVVFYNVKVTAKPKNNGKDEKNSFNEVVTLVKTKDGYKYSRMQQAAI